MSSVFEISGEVRDFLSSQTLAGQSRFYSFLDKISLFNFNVDHVYTDHAKGGLNAPQVDDLILQFSVFSNHFLPIQCKYLVSLAGNEAAERQARNILVNELGVPIDTKTGEAEGRRFSHGHAHINWLRETASLLDLYPPHIPYPLGHWNLGSPATHEFLRRLDAAYCKPGASFAIETWAGYGIGKGKELEEKNFWKRLIAGLGIFNEGLMKDGFSRLLMLGFFEYHFATESGHAASVVHELAETFFKEGFDQEAWIAAAQEALEAMHIFWKGLEEKRLLLT